MTKASMAELVTVNDKQYMIDHTIHQDGTIEWSYFIKHPNGVLSLYKRTTTIHGSLHSINGQPAETTYNPDAKISCEYWYSYGELQRAAYYDFGNTVVVYCTFGRIDRVVCNGKERSMI